MSSIGGMVIKEIKINDIFVIYTQVQFYLCNSSYFCMFILEFDVFFIFTLQM